MDNTNIPNITSILLTALMLFVFQVSFSQSKKEDLIKAIDRSVANIDRADTATKRITISGRDLEQYECLCQAMDYSLRNDSIIKISRWILHVAIKHIEYYYHNKELILMRFTNKHPEYDTASRKDSFRIIEEASYYFHNRKLIKISSLKKKQQINKVSAQYLLTEAQQYLYSVLNNRKE